MDEELNAPLAEQDQEQAQAASNLLSDPITVSADDFAKARQYSADNDVPLTMDPETLKRLARTFDMVPPDVQRSPAMRGIIADAMYYGLAKDRLKELNEVAKEMRRQADEKRYEEQSRYQKDYRPYAFLGSLEKGFQNIVYKNATLAKGLFKDWLYNLPINSENGEEIDTSSFEPLRKKWADESTRETAADMGAIAAEQMSNPLPPSLNAVYDELNEKGKTISGGISVILEHPSEMAALAAQSVASVVPQVALTVAGGVIGGPAGAMAAAGLASGVVDYLSEVSQRVEEDYYKNGGKMDTPPDEAWIQFFNNPEKRAELEKLAALHALPVAVLDALSAGLAGRFVSAAVRSAAKTGHAGLKVGTAAAGELAVQAGLGAGGEALGQLLSEGQVKDVAGVWLEGIAEVFGAPFEARGNWSSYRAAADRYNFFDKAQRVSEAFRFNDAMRILSEKVKATGMKERHAEDVTAKVVQDTAGEDAVVYVDAEGLEQDGIAEIAKEASPTVREQYDKAREQGGNIEVPIGEYAATLGALDQSDLIHQNAKANPDGMTAKEASAQAEALADNYESAITAARKAYDAASAAADEAVKADDAFKASNPNAAPDAIASSKARAGEAIDEALKARGQVEALEREARAVLGEEGFQKLEEKLNAKEEPAEAVGIREFAKNLKQSERAVAKNIYDTIKQFGKWKPDTAKFLAVAFARIAAILGERDGGKTAEEFMSRSKPLQILAEKVGQGVQWFQEGKEDDFGAPVQTTIAGGVHAKDTSEPGRVLQDVSEQDAFPAAARTRNVLTRGRRRTIRFPVANTEAEIAANFADQLSGNSVETSAGMLINADGKVVAYFPAGVGRGGEVDVNVESVIARAFQFAEKKKGKYTLYLAHNHPGEYGAKLSKSDTEFSTDAYNALRGSSLEYGGFFALGENTEGFYPYELADKEGKRSSGKAAEGGKRGGVSEYSARTAMGEKRPDVGDRRTLIKNIIEDAAGREGVAFISHQWQPVGFMEVPLDKAEVLRKNGRLDEAWRGYAMQGSPRYAYIVTKKGEKFENIKKGALNLAHFLNNLDLEVSDIIIPYDDGTWRAMNDLHRVPDGAPSFWGGNVQTKDDERYTEFYSPDARGSFDPEEMIMRLAKRADVSTFMHESAHYFLELYAIAVQDIAQRAQAGETLTQGEQSLLNDFATAMRWAGMSGEDADIIANFSSMPVDEKRPYHEKFARGFEAYLFEGKAPSENSRLKKIFRAFASWLKAIYRSLANLGVDLNDDIRGVFDRMFASEAEILATKRAREQGALFKSREEGGMTEAEWEAYRDMNTETALSAVETMRRKALSDMRFARLLRRKALDELTQEQRRAYKFFEDQARQEVMSEPVSRAWVWLTNKITGADRMRNAREGNTAAGEGRQTNAGRLEEASVREVLSQYEDGEAIFNVLQQRGFLRKREGVTVADAITLMGDKALSEQYDTSEEDGAYRFLRAMAAIRDPEQRVKAKVERRMLEEFSQLASAKAVGEEADILVHSPIAARFAESEAKALERLNGTARSLKRDAKAAAEDAVRSIQLKRLFNRKYAKECAKNAEKHGKEARKRYGSNDLAGAAESMRLKAFNTAMVDQAVRTEDRIRRDLKDLLRFTSKNFKLHQVNLRLIHKILARFGFMPEALMIEPSVVAGDVSLAQWRQDAQNLGFDVPMDDLVLDEFNRAEDYTNLSVEDFYAVYDAVMTIYAQGKVMATNYLKGKAEKNAETATALAESARKNADPKRAGKPAGLPSALETAKRGFTAAKYWLLKASTIFYTLDGGKENGEFMKTFMYSADERTAWEAQKRADTMKVIQDILAPMQTLTGLDLKKTYVPSTGMSFTKENAFIAVANMGNVQNIKRLLDGFGWEKEQLLDIARLLTKDELLRVQRVWDVFESFVPDIARMSLRVDGHEPEWVKPQPITVMSADGQEVTLKGGYFPIQYDIKAKSFFHLTEEEAKAADTGYIAATTRRTYMKKRKDDVGLGHPVLLSFTTLTKGLNEVIHDLAFREWGIWAQHLWHSPVVTDAIHQTMGREGGYVVATIDGWIKDILVGDMKPQADAEKAVAALRRYVAVVGLAFNVKTMLVQPLGITNTMGRIGAAYTWRGLQYFLRDPKAAMAEAYRIAPELELRTRARTRDLAEALSMIHVGGKVQQWLQNWGMAGMLTTQRWTDCATWWGAYMKAADEGHSQEDARRIANRIVDDAQGGGSVASLAAAERGGPALKLFTSFYTFFGATANTFMGQWATNAKSMSERFALWCFCIAIPAIAESILTALVTPSDADDPWDDLPSDIVADLIQYHLSLAPIVRELTDVGRGVAATVTGGKGPRRPYGYSGPAGTRLIKDLNDLVYMASTGKFDERFIKTLATVTGLLTGMVPAAQLNRTIKGMNAMMEGETENPLALVFGMERTKRKRKAKPSNEF